MSEPESLSAVLARLACLPAARAADDARADQDARWRAGERPPAEVYLAALPAVAADPEQALVLIYGEILAREACGEAAVEAEYRRRFPHLADRLALQFAVHAALAASPTGPTGAYHPTPTGPPPERFPPGVLLVGRYRVVAPLGKGGMGEVYRADDLTLGQPVALKFLPLRIAADPDRLARFRKEVAAARKVSHPNVCRVYDIAEYAGQSFLTMEFVDGEDLSSVLKRLGRVPQEKGVEVARQLCGALAAVHDQGLLHRDLKPANVMLDGRGKVRLTDFGLAAAAEDLSGTEVRSGTPLYQSPEQLSGQGVTARSDLYALGLVLYEVFTGRRAFADARRDSTPSKPSSHVGGLDPAVEAIILKCLEADPANRPRSAVEVLSRLPGGDPLAAAVSAGETPSPQLVADADPGDARLRPGVAWALVAAVVAGIVITGWLATKTHLSSLMPLRDADPAVMRYKAKGVLDALGHDEPAGDSAVRYVTDMRYYPYATEQPRAEGWIGRWAELGDGRPPVMVVLYRTARGRLVPANHVAEFETPGWVGPLNPAPLEPGMADVTLDLRGRLVRFHAVADFLGPEAPPSRPPAADWRRAFDAAELDHEAFAAHPVPPRHHPPLAADARFAWEGPYPGLTFDRVRVEAASLRGKPVYFAIEFPWQAGEKAAAYPTYSLTAGDFADGLVLMSYAMPAIAFVLALWNWRAGRADLAGAATLTGVMFVLWLARWGLTAHHVPDARESLLVHPGLGLAAGQAAVMGLFYLALEPVLRKRWPWRLVGWTRLLAGRLRDPLVGRDILVGMAAGAAVALSVTHYGAGPFWAPEVAAPYWGGDFEMHPVRCVTQPFTGAVRFGLTYFFFLFLVVRVFGERRWLAFVAFASVIVAAFATNPTEPKPLAAVVSTLAAVVVLWFIALRFGMLAFAAACALNFSLTTGGWSLNVGAWYATGPNLGVAMMLAITLYAAYTATEGRLFGPRDVD